MMQQHAASFIAYTEASTVAESPRFNEDESDAFLECGIPAHGFLRLRCGDCAPDELPTFNCKRRGFCPPCGARRMTQTSAHPFVHVLPRVPVRQWVLSLAIPLRVLLAAQPELVPWVLKVVQCVVTRHLLDWMMERVYLCGAEGAPNFIESTAPTDDELHGLLQTVIARLMSLLARRAVGVDLARSYAKRRLGATAPVLQHRLLKPARCRAGQGAQLQAAGAGSAATSRGRRCQTNACR